MTADGIIISAYVQKKSMGSTCWHNSFLTPKRQEAFLYNGILQEVYKPRSSQTVNWHVGT